MSKKAKAGFLTQGEYIKNCIYLAVFNLVTFALFNAEGFRNLTQIHAINSKIVVNAQNIGSFISSAASQIRKRITSEVQKKMFSVKLDVATRHSRSVLGVNIQFYCENRKKLIIRTLGCI